MNKDVIIFVNAIRPETFEALKEYESRTGRQFKAIVLVDKAIKESIFTCNGQNNLPEKPVVLTADFSSPASLISALKPYEGRIFAVTSQYENCIQELRRLLPYVPYVPTPTKTSLARATEKKFMRKMMEAYDPSLVPKYLEVSDAALTTVEKIETALSYPMIVKPSGLEGSLLVSHVRDRGELEDTLARTFQLIQSSYDTWVKRQKTAVLIEEFMVGDMYTIDVYIDAHGLCYFTPAIYDIVGRQVGYDDFFVYRDCLPSGLDNDEEQMAQQAARSASYALGLRSTTAHVEMMHTADGWKIIEVGPRIGGDRYDLLKLAYGINHIMNDILIRADEKPDLPLELRTHVAIFDLYARTEGTLRAVHGLEETRKLLSFTDLRQNIFVGQPALFAKNGGDVVIHVMLSHADKSQLEADAAALEAAISFDVEPEPITRRTTKELYYSN